MNGSIDDAYSKMLDLVAHYSATIFQARVLIVTVTVLGWAAGLGILSGDGSSAQSSPIASVWRPTVFLGAALTIACLMFMENLYISLYRHVMAAGAAIEPDPCNFFRQADPPRFWPFALYYFLNVTAMAGAALVEVRHVQFEALDKWFVVAALVPVIVAILAVAQLQQLSKARIPPAAQQRRAAGGGHEQGKK
ncbi:MAG: hypothetical protein HY899_13355 [Deltaproteobacteria bacterium]|nr:hypothetical protein [Deltaproteobacteria bacterium]